MPAFDGSPSHADPVEDEVPYRWSRDAACRGMDSRFWFPERGEITSEAKQVCGACPVREDCLDESLRNGERHGVWGGLSERQRRQIRRKSRQVTGSPSSVAGAGPAAAAPAAGPSIRGAA